MCQSLGHTLQRQQYEAMTEIMQFIGLGLLQKVSKPISRYQWRHILSKGMLCFSPSFEGNQKFPQNASESLLE